MYYIFLIPVKYNLYKNHYRTEKNACAWSQEKLKELFLDAMIEGDGG